MKTFATIGLIAIWSYAMFIAGGADSQIQLQQKDKELSRKDSVIAYQNDYIKRHRPVLVKGFEAMKGGKRKHQDN